MVAFLASGSADAVMYRGACGEVGILDPGQGSGRHILEQLDYWSARDDVQWIAVSNYEEENLGHARFVGRADGVHWPLSTVFDRGGGPNAYDSDAYRTYLEWATDNGLRSPVDIGDDFTLCDGEEQATFEVVSAGTDGTAAGGVPVDNEKDRSLCLHLQFRDFDLADCSDVAGPNRGGRSDVETPAAAAFGDVEVARVSGRGAGVSSNAEYVSTLSPEVAIIQPRPGIPPAADVVQRWNAAADVFQTEPVSDGSLATGIVTVVTDGIDGFRVRGPDDRSRDYTFDESPTSPAQVPTPSLSESEASAPSPESRPDLLLSSSPTRADATPLEGQTLSGDAYVYVAAPEETQEVSFWVDGPERSSAPHRVESLAAYDLAGTTRTGDAIAFDTTELADGQHTVAAAVSLPDGNTDVVTSTFKVDNVPETVGRTQSFLVGNA